MNIFFFIYERCFSHSLKSINKIYIFWDVLTFVEGEVGQDPPVPPGQRLGCLATGLLAQLDVPIFDVFPPVLQVLEADIQLPGFLLPRSLLSVVVFGTTQPQVVVVFEPLHQLFLNHVGETPACLLDPSLPPLLLWRRLRLHLNDINWKCTK